MSSRSPHPPFQIPDLGSRTQDPPDSGSRILDLGMTKPAWLRQASLDEPLHRSGFQRATVRAAPLTVQDSRGRPRSVHLQGLRHCPEFEPRSNKGPVGMKIRSLSLGKIQLDSKILHNCRIHQASVALGRRLRCPVPASLHLSHISDHILRL